MKKIAAVIVAGGAGQRFGDALPKQYHLLKGKPILPTTVDVFLNHPLISEVIVVVGEKDAPYYHQHISSHPKLKLPVIGGGNRQASVYAGLKALEAHLPDYVLIHDAVRPFVTDELINRVVTCLEKVPGCIPAVPIHDTVKKVEEGSQQILQTLDRQHLWLAQTPQGFHYSSLYKAHKTFKGEDHFTDDAALLEALGEEVIICAGDPQNKKITYRQDLIEMNFHFPDIRVGNGFDVHQLIPGNGLKILGVFIPGELSLKGHSDADVALHSLTDALFGAMGDGDIGIHFPPTDERWRGADSTHFLKYALERLQQKGGKLNHVDITLIGEKPKFSPYRDQFLASLEALLGLNRDRIGVKATTTEKLGFLGRGEGLAVQATATVLF